MYFYVFILNYTGLIIHLQPICIPVLDNYKEFSVGKKKSSSTLVRVKKKLPDKKYTKTWNISGMKGIMKI